MKMKSKILMLFMCFLLLVCLSGCSIKDYNNNKTGLVNPWTDCITDYNCASKIAGFTLPLGISDCTVRAMKGMIEITYPLDEKRYVTLRKSDTEINSGDISGDYNEYFKTENLALNNGVVVTIRKNNDGLIHVMYFAAESGYYSANSKEGMNINDIYDIYNLLAKVEVPKFPNEAD